MNKIDKLPKWAQDYIKKLKRSIELQGDLIKALQQYNPKSDIYYQLDYLKDESKIYIPDRSVMFGEYNGMHRFTVDYLIKDKAIAIRGMSAIKVMPEAGNAIRIEIDE